MSKLVGYRTVSFGPRIRPKALECLGLEKVIKGNLCLNIVPIVIMGQANGRDISDVNGFSFGNLGNFLLSQQVKSNCLTFDYILKIKL